MAFDPSKFQSKTFKEKALPVLLLLDVSGSMQGEKIESLHAAVQEMAADFVRQGVREIHIKIAVITFGASVDCPVRYTDARDLRLPQFTAEGMTPLGTALEMAKDMFEDKEETKGYWYRPAVVLVSDGYPTDEYSAPLNAFIATGRSAKAQRMAVGIGDDADEEMLRRFVSDETFLFHADGASDIAAQFKLATMSTIQRMASQNPNEFSGAVRETPQMPADVAPSLRASEEEEFL